MHAHDPQSPPTTRGFQPRHALGFQKGERPPSRRYSREETAQHRATADALLATAEGTEPYVVRQLRARFGCGVGHARRVVRSVLDEWTQPDAPVSVARVQAIARVRQMLHDAMGRPKVAFNAATGKMEQQGWVEKPDFAAIVRYERLLMRLEQTEAPEWT